MDFAKKQLERMGWTEGKGLGLNEDGIIKALKPNVQLNSRGLGFNVADSIQIKNQWWSEAYNSASKGLKHDYKITSVGVVVKPQKSDSNSSESSSDKYGSRFKSAGYLERYEDKIILEQENEKKKKKEKKNKKSKKSELDDNIVDHQDEEECEDDDNVSKKHIEVLDVEIIPDSKEIEDFEPRKSKKNKKKQLQTDDKNLEEEDRHKNDNKVQKKDRKKCQEFEDKSEENDKKSRKKNKELKHIDFNEIFQMSEGMTCHKAARHGINMTGKMKRLQEQETEFLKKFKSCA